MPYTSAGPFKHIPDAQFRAAERNAVCRFCEEDINKGDKMLTWYTNCARGQYIHLHPHCVLHLSNIIINEMIDNPPMSGKEASEL